MSSSPRCCDWIEREPESSTGWLAAMRDPQIGRVLAAIHREPEKSWSVDELASLAGLSRSIFHQRFMELLGVSPARYVAQRRMDVARRLLRENRLSVAQTAARLGYESESSFSRAFKRLTGHAPGFFRRSR